MQISHISRRPFLKYSILLLLLCTPLISLATAVTLTENKVSPSNYDQTKDVFPIDLDEDGDMDIVSVSDVLNDVTWWENDGDENFTQRTIDGSFTDPYSIYAADLDEDDDLDVVACSADSGDQLKWYRNDGSENFTGVSIATGLSSCTAVTVSDVDSDGDNDLVTAEYSTGLVSWWNNDGSGNFTKNLEHDSASSVWDVYAGDIDDDGDIDIAVAVFGLYDIIWLKNDGSENFTPITIDGNLGQAHSVYLSDLDEDGDMDVLATGRLDDDVVWYENDGSENFTKNFIDENGLDGASDVTSGDMDGDGDLDVAAAGQFGNDQMWYDNDGSESFTKRTVSSSFDGAYRSVISDIDGDGDNDILTSGNTNNDDGVQWYESSGDTTAPTVSTLSPTDGATDVSTTTNLVITFNETIAKTGTGTVTIKDASDDSEVEVIAVTGALVTGSGTTSITINPDTTLDEGTDYYVHVHANAFPDASGNYYAGISDSTTWNFTTEDLTDPVISAQVPANNAVDVGTGSSVTWTTDELTSSQVQYGYTESFGFLTAVADTSPRVTSHSVSMSLVACTEYHYRVISIDASGNTTTGSTLKFATTGCENSATVESQTGATVTEVAGGTLELLRNSSGARLTIPANYSTNEAVFQIKRINKTTLLALTARPSGMSDVGNHYYDFRALSGTTTVTSFDESITVTMQYTEDQISGLDESTLRIYRWDGSSWNVLSSCSVDTALNTVTCTTTQFSSFGLFGSSATSSASSTSVASSGGGGGHRGSAASMEKKIAQAGRIFKAKRKGVQLRVIEDEDDSSDEYDQSEEESSKSDHPVMTPAYRDLPESAWFTPHVHALIQNGIAEGYRDARGNLTGEFNPQNAITLAEVVKMGCAISGINPDVSRSKNLSARGTWAERFISFAEKNGISLIDEDRDVHQPVTRGEAIRLLLEVLGQPIVSYANPFADLPPSHPHEAAISTGVMLGIVDGDTKNGKFYGTVRPDDPVNRAEIAAIIGRMIRESLAQTNPLHHLN